MEIHVTIMTPDGVFWDNKAKDLILPTNTGQMGVLFNHAPLMTALDIGVVLIRTDKRWVPVAIMGGFALVKENHITILVNVAESADTLEFELIENAFQEAQKELDNVNTPKERVDAIYNFKRARARYQALQQLRN